MKEHALKYKMAFDFDIIPVENKKPNLKSWKKWQDNIQSTKNIESINWNHKTNGIAVINKSGLITLDFDKCNDEKFITEIVNELGLNDWLVRTGKGFHNHLICLDIENLDKEFGNSGVNILYPKGEFKDKLIRLELRKRGCYSKLPPSLHVETGKEYIFINGYPEIPPSKISAKELIEVLSKYFELKSLKKETTHSNNENEKSDLILSLENGVSQGERHPTLVKLFTLFYHQGLGRKMIIANLKNWNYLNRPPIAENEFNTQVEDLWKRFSKGNDNIFYQFENCLMALDCDYKTKLKKIFCYSVVEFDEDSKIINDLNLNDKLEEYHKECKELVNKFNIESGKEQIVRIGKSLMLDVIKGGLKYDMFSVYVGIHSYVGRTDLINRIAYSVISARAMGYKDFDKYLMSDSKQKPLSVYRIKKAMEYLERGRLITYFSPVSGQMIRFSTRIKSKKKLEEIITKKEIEKLDTKIEQEERKLKIQNSIKEKRERLKGLRKKTKVYSPPSYE